MPAERSARTSAYTMSQRKWFQGHDVDLVEALAPFVRAGGREWLRYTENKKVHDTKVVKELILESADILLAILRLSENLLFQKSQVRMAMAILCKEHGRAWNLTDDDAEYWEETMVRRFRNLCYITNRLRSKKEKTPEWFVALERKWPILARREPGGSIASGAASSKPEGHAEEVDQKAKRHRGPCRKQQVVSGDDHNDDSEKAEESEENAPSAMKDANDMDGTREEKECKTGSGLASSSIAARSRSAAASSSSARPPLSASQSVVWFEPLPHDMPDEEIAMMESPEF